MSRRFFWILCSLFIGFFGIYESLPLAVTGQRLRIGAFSERMPGGGFPAGWEPLTFDGIDRETIYRLVRDDGNTVVRAESRDAASGMIRRLAVDPREFPVLRWRWKIMNFVPRTDGGSKAGDDFPARVLVAFAFDAKRASFWSRVRAEAAKAVRGDYPPAGALVYVWSGRGKTGDVFPSPFTDRARVIVVENGESARGRWKTEERNIAEDYRNAFGESPPEVSGVAIMTDTDNTGGTALAFYADIEFRSP